LATTVNGSSWILIVLDSGSCSGCGVVLVLMAVPGAVVVAKEASAVSAAAAAAAVAPIICLQPQQ